MCRAQVAGDYFGVNNDGVYNLPYTTVFDLMEDAGVSYKVYLEASPGRCRLWGCVFGGGGAKGFNQACEAEAL